MGTCAYCGVEAPLTREHVFSDWIGREFGEMRSQSEGAPDRQYQGLLKIKDVCARCNNGPLSELDSYAKTLNMHVRRCRPRICRVRLKADRDRLTRYLLKSSFNDARVTVVKARNAGNSTEPYQARVQQHRVFADFILGKTSPLQLDVVAGISEFQKRVGAGDVPLVGAECQLFLCRAIILGAHRFIVNAWNPGTPNEFRERSMVDLEDGQNWTWLRSSAVDVRLKRSAVVDAVDPAGRRVRW